MEFNSIDVSMAASVFKVLSNPDRLMIACHMMNGDPTSESQLIEEIGWPQSTVNRHLAMLRDGGLIQASREGNRLQLTLNSEVTLALMKTMCDYMRERENKNQNEGTALGAPVTGVVPERGNHEAA